MKKVRMKKEQKESNEQFERMIKEIAGVEQNGTGQDDLPTKEEIRKEVDALEYQHNDPPSEPVPIVSIDKQIILTPGNILDLTGGSKTGKSAVLNAIQAGTMRAEGEVPFDTLGLEIARNIYNYLVIHFCTEQSEWDYWKSITSILNRAGRSQPPIWFKSYHFLRLDLRKRQAYIEDTVDRYANEFGGVYLITVDGIADLLRSPNDEALSFDLVEWAQKMAADYSSGFNTDLHFNPGSDLKSRGHLGSHLERKSESVLTLTKNKETGISTLDQNLLRNGGYFDPLQFKYDLDKKYHVACGTKNVAKEAASKIENTGIAVRVFSGKSDGLIYTDLTQAIMDDCSRSERWATTKITEMKGQDIVKMAENRKYVLCGDNISDHENKKSGFKANEEVQKRCK